MVPAVGIMTVRDLAAFLNVGEKTVYRLAKRGEIPGFKVAGTWRFKHADIDAWIEERKARVVKESSAAALRGPRPRASYDERRTKGSRG